MLISKEPSCKCELQADPLPRIADALRELAAMFPAESHNSQDGIRNM